MPPTVAQKSSDSSSGPQVTTRPSATSSSTRRMWSANEPSTWWFLPWMSQAMAPPTVTNCVPGTTGGKKPRGTNTFKTSSSETPASAVSQPVSSSKASIRSRREVTTMRPSGRSAVSP